MTEREVGLIHVTHSVCFLYEGPRLLVDDAVIANSIHAVDTSLRPLATLVALTKNNIGSLTVSYSSSPFDHLSQSFVVTFVPTGNPISLAYRR